jgi:hypothetical protein
MLVHTLRNQPLKSPIVSVVKIQRMTGRLVAVEKRRKSVDVTGELEVLGQTAKVAAASQCHR